jgi:NIMA (never in mitosis gene a)-related kinase
LVQLAPAIFEYNKHKVLHSDRKSDNIFITQERRVKITDFGVSRLLEYPFQQASTFTGTPSYMASEVHFKQPFSCASDIWNLG